MWIFFGFTLFVVWFANYFYSLFVKKKIKLNTERQVSVDKKLRKFVYNKVRTQNGMVLIEIGDVGSDTLNGVLKLQDLLNSADDVVPWLWVLFVVVAAVAVPLGVYQITNRGRLKASYRAIINGTDEELLEALDENSDVISAESIKIRRTLVALDLSVTKLGLRGLYIEDVPSLVANAVAIVYAMAQGTKGTMSTYATLMAFMFSCGMAGRKSGLRSLERDLVQKKGELEALENMDEAAKENRANMLRQQSEIAHLQDHLRKKKHSEDELAVMKAAMDGLEEMRKDELKEVLIKSSEVKVSRLLGKGGFGVVNLATYRGQQTAMKQLLTINDESVKRFRFECFLMKSLRHPNIVKLVGVCWEDSLFACCLEFVENGSLEDWLRRTAGGTAYDLSKKKKKKKKPQKKNDAHQTRCQRIFDGFDHTHEYDPSLLTDVDELEITSAIATMERIRGSCSDWTPLLTDDGTPFPHSIQGWCQFNQETKWGESLAILPRVNAPPSQVFAKHTEVMDKSRETEETARTESIHEDFMTRLEFVPVPMSSPLHDREMLYRGVYKKLEGGGFIHISYDVEDERRPLSSGSTRMGVKFALLVRPLEGSDGKASEVWRCMHVQVRRRRAGRERAQSERLERFVLKEHLRTGYERPRLCVTSGPERASRSRVPVKNGRLQATCSKCAFRAPLSCHQTHSPHTALPAAQLWLDRGQYDEFDGHKEERREHGRSIGAFEGRN